MSKRVTILGAGSWGMAVSRLLQRAGCRVTLWEFVPEDYRLLLRTRSNPDKLADFRLPDEIDITDNLEAAVSDPEVVVFAVPSQHLRSVLVPIADQLAHVPTLVNLAKGIENGTLKRMSEVIAEVTGAGRDQVVTLSGPSHAEEVILDMPTTVVAASTSEPRATLVQELFSDGNFRVYRSDDIVGVELAGSLKNIVAIATGIADGLGMGDNTRGALITRGLAEITRLGLALGARPDTFAGLSGVGDLVTTCASRHSRNRFVGEQIGRGRRLDDILKSMKMIAEGVDTARSGYELALRCHVEVPITDQVYRVLFENKSARQAVSDLMGRKLREEVWQ
jgi:glycerol-3-phosphate dehydrogenase (NAD(P)+)